MRIPIETIKKCIRDHTDAQISTEAFEFLREYVHKEIEKTVERVVELQAERNKLRKTRGIPIKKRISAELLKTALREGNA